MHRREYPLGRDMRSTEDFRPTCLTGTVGMFLVACLVAKLLRFDTTSVPRFAVLGVGSLPAEAIVGRPKANAFESRGHEVPWWFSLSPLKLG